VSTPDARLAELSQKLRMPPRPTERPKSKEPVAAVGRPAPVEAAIAEAAPAEPAGAYVQKAEPRSTGFDDVTIRPLAPKQPVFTEHSDEPYAAAGHEPPPRTFIPPAPERPAARATRMPPIEDFPLPGQNVLRARQHAQTEPAERPKMGLLQRLASIGLGHREESAGSHEPQPAPRQPARTLEREILSPPQRLPEPRMPDPVSEYARRPAPPNRHSPQGLDSHGRTAPAPHPHAHEDDQLEIPAFLRRQAK
jgi:cell division protein FtsZ